MSVITFFGGFWCRAEEVAEKTAKQLGYKFINNEMLIKETVSRFPADKAKLERAMYGTPSFLNNITHDKEKSIVYLKAALSEMIKNDSIVFFGFAGLLLPKEITHILKVYIIANMDYRSEIAVKAEDISLQEANRLIRKNDNDVVRWTQYLFGKAPWEKSLYDIILPMHSTSISDSVKIICENAEKDTVQTTGESRNALDDFILANKINIKMIEEGHNVSITCSSGDIRILLNKFVLRFENSKREIEDIVNSFLTPKSIDVAYAQGVNLPNTARQIDIEYPSKILLVDDEVEFVHTLSERLKTRRIESSVVYDGDEALSVIEEGEPEVMLLDLKMPGIDGIEVLRKVKSTNPNVEVIILTGHGSTKEKELAEELGAFAYLEKPADISILTQTMQDAYKKIAKNKSG